MTKGESCGVETKEKILKIALKLFIERGFFEVSINYLIKKVGIPKRVFYHYFKPKDIICEVMKSFCFHALKIL